MSGFAASSQEVQSYINGLQSNRIRDLKNDEEIKLRARIAALNGRRGVPCGSPYGTNWQKNQVYCEHYERFMSARQYGGYRKTKSKAKRTRKAKKSRKTRK